MSDWHRRSCEDVVARLKSDAEQGLTPEEAARRLKEFGRNELPRRETRGPLEILFAQFTSIMVIVLLVAGAVSLVLGEWVDALAIMAIVILNAGLGFFQEFRAERALVALRALAVPKVRVRRGGQVVEVSSPEVVPGDIVLLDAGTRVPADGRLLEAVNLRLSEASLTGESEPVEKQTEVCPVPAGEGEVPLTERRNMVYMGTAAVAGRGVMVVTETGARTELGKIADMLQSAKREPTPLQKRLERMARELALAVLVIVAVVFVLGVLRGEDYRRMFLIAVALAVAAVPEGLPAVVTIALTLGARRMLLRNALIRRLNAVETLGSVTVICSDKTGTLTQNQMTVTVLDVAGEELDLQVIRAKKTGKGDKLDVKLSPGLMLLVAGGALCNDACCSADAGTRAGGGMQVFGEPTESALLLAALDLGIDPERLRRLLPRVAEVPFSSERKRMSTVHRIVGDSRDTDQGLSPASEEERLLISVFQTAVGKEGKVLFTKGAVDVLLEMTKGVFVQGRVEPLNEEWRSRISAAQERLSRRGIRVLGVGFRPVKDEELAAGVAPETLERELVFIGMTGMIDPARPEVKEAVRVCREAGIRPVMITGDHPLTALFIAEDIGIISGDGADKDRLCQSRHASALITGPELSRLSVEELAEIVDRIAVYARVTPADKLAIVSALQRRQEVVAMTGDGVNDAPALKRADIGVAMGITGTDVAKEAADMVLLDDNFATIVAAVREGRAIYDNIRKFIRYTFASNAGEIWAMVIAPFLGMPFPLTPLQILWVNLVTDGLPGLALGIEPPERDVMRRPPRRLNESIFAHGMATSIIWSGLLMALVSLGVGFLFWSRGYHTWRTMLFTTLTMAQLWQSLALRSFRDSVFKMGLLTNRVLVGTFILTLGLQLLVIYLPFLQRVFSTVALKPVELLITLGLSTVVFWAVELEKLLKRKSGSTEAPKSRSAAEAR